jgi:DNA repair protein RecO
VAAGEFQVTDGVILARREVADDAVRIDCYTRRFGRLTGYLRKARWEKVFAAAPGSLGELTLREPLSAAAPLISAYERKAMLYREGMHPSSYWGILTVLEALYRLLPYKEADPGLYKGAVETLVVLSRDGRPVPTVIAFLLHLLEAAGYRWRLGRCRRCGTEAKGEYLLLPEDGALACRRCRGEGGGGVPLSWAALVALRNLGEVGPSRASTVSLHRDVAAEVLGALALGIPCHFDRRLESLAMLRPGGRPGRSRLTGSGDGARL